MLDDFDARLGDRGDQRPSGEAEGIMSEAKGEVWGVWRVATNDWLEGNPGIDWVATEKLARLFARGRTDVEARPYRRIEPKDRASVGWRIVRLIDPGGPPWGWGVWNIEERQWVTTDGDRPWSGDEEIAKRLAEERRGYEARAFPRDQTPNGLSGLPHVFEQDGLRGEPYVPSNAFHDLSDRRQCVRCAKWDVPSLNMQTDLCRACEVDAQNRPPPCPECRAWHVDGKIWHQDSCSQAKIDHTIVVTCAKPDLEQALRNEGSRMRDWLAGTSRQIENHKTSCDEHMLFVSVDHITPPRNLDRERANALADECQRLKDELTEVLAENARLRRSLERETKAGTAK